MLADWGQTLAAAGSAVEKYADQKRARQETARKCEAAGVWFQPLLFDAQGSMTQETGVIVHQLAKAVARAENTEFEGCKRDIVERFSLIIARANSRSISRRNVRRTTAVSEACKRAHEATRLEDAT